MKGWLIAPLIGGQTAFVDADGNALLYRAMAMVMHLPDYSWAIWMVSGTAAQLSAINALPDSYGICTQSELDTVISAARRTRMNAWLSARGWPTIPAGRTYRQVLLAAARKLLPAWQEADTEVADE